MDCLRNSLNAFHRLFENVRAASSLMKRMGSSDRDFDKAFEIINSDLRFSPSQKIFEIRQLFEKIKRNDCVHICEIGTLKGGTLFLFCQAASPNAKLIAVDINMPPYRSMAYKKFARKDQKVFCVEGDSKADSTFRKVQSILKPELLDFLFIDGDHSYEGVKNDFEKYSVLVKKGGFIAFHDIVELGPDSPTDYYVGGVPKFWREIKTSYPRTEEYIKNPDQEGFGIRVLTKDW